MALIATTAPYWVPGILGDEWTPAIPLVQVLAVTGARQAVTSLNAPILLGMDKSDLHLRFNIVASVTQVSGILIGVQWGPLGVAWGYTIAGFLMMPFVYWFQNKAASMSLRDQIEPLLPAMHVTFWLVVSTLLAGNLTSSSDWFAALIWQILAAIFSAMTVVTLFHRRAAAHLLKDLAAALPRRGQQDQ